MMSFFSVIQHKYLGLLKQLWARSFERPSSNVFRQNMRLFKKKNGLEIGGPSSLFSEIYKRCSSCDDVNFSPNTVWWSRGSSDSYVFANKKLGKIYIADAVDMNGLSDERYDFVMSSNNLEHIANPIKALSEFKRVAKTGGTIIIAVPIKKYMFDHQREHTTFEHLLNDYNNNTPETDLTHLPEILELHDYAMDPPAGGPENFKKRSARNYENRCLHHHVFCEDTLRCMFNYLALEVISFSECSGNYIIIGRKG